jgi:hypothetical protein
MVVGIWWVVLFCVISFAAGVFVYRNNVDIFAPFAKKIDEKHDEIKRLLLIEIEKLRSEVKKKNKEQDRRKY